MKIKTVLALSLTMLALLAAGCGNSANTTTTAVNKTNTTANSVVNTAAINTGNVSETKTNTAQAESNANTAPAAELPERKQVLDALRVPVGQELKQDIIFKVDQYKAEGDWAFVSASPRNKDGGAPNWKITKYQKFIDNGDFEDGVFGLLKRSGGKWTVVTYLMNCHDVCYLTWADDYKAPKSLFK